MRLEEVTQYFPSGIAQGKAFINREKERKQLRKNIIANRHMVLMAPRRYGKTSLVHQVAEEAKIPFCIMDLLAVHSDESVKDIFFDKVGKLIGELLPPVHHAKEKLFSIFSSMKPELSLSAFGQRLVLHMPTSNAVSNITELLLKLDETATHFEKRAILFIDEMQQITFLKNAHSIEASLRHAIERSKSITYCFSGSSRHLLKGMFGDSSRPLYRLCHTLEIERMAEEHYHQHLNQLARERWNCALDEAVFKTLMRLTEGHPFYVNALCQCVWMEDQIPDALTLEAIWRNYVQANRHVIADDVIGLSLNQKQVLTTLAHHHVTEMYGADFLGKVKLSQSSVRKSVDVLLEKDLIYHHENIYDLIDPAIKYFLKNLG